MRSFKTLLLAGALIAAAGVATAETAPGSTCAPAINAAQVQYDPIAAAFERDVDQMLQQAAAMQAQLLMAQPFDQAPFDQSPLTEASFANLPANGDSYVLISSSSPKGSCTQSMQITQQAGGVQHVVSKTSGDCSGVPALTVASPPEASTAPTLTPARDTAPSANHAADNHVL